MKKTVHIVILQLILISSFGYSQPGPVHKNLNENFLLADVIVIDSTSDLSRIQNLKGLDRLSLKLYNLKSIPKEFKDFINTKRLRISFWNTNANELSFLNEFPNLTYLSIDGFEGEVLSKQKLKLDSLNNLEIGYCNNLHDIEAIKGLTALKELRIEGSAYLKKFPKFGKNNSITQLTIDHMSNGRSVNEEHPKNFKTDITNIRYLQHLEEIVLGSLVDMHTIPDFLPKTIKKLEITGWALHPWKGDKVEITSIENLKLYPELKELKLYNINMKRFEGNFKSLSLDHLLLWLVADLNDISGIFTFKNINKLQINNCPDLKDISGLVCNTHFENFEVQQSLNIKNIDFLLTCNNINQLIITEANSLKLSSSQKMDRIKNISIFDNNDKIRIYKKNNVWIENIIIDN